MSHSWVDGTKLVCEYVVGDLCQCSGEFDARWSGTHHDKIQGPGGLACYGLPLRKFECQQHAAPNLKRVLDSLQAGREGSPLIVAEIGMRRACGDDQVVVGKILLAGVHEPPLEIKALHLFEQADDVRIATEIERIGAAISPGESPAVATW